MSVAIFTGQAAFAQDVTLPKTMVWTSYDLGSTGYVEASAIADALDKMFGTTVRITPSGTGIGRLLPLKTGRANFGFMGNEILFASEGTYEFAARDWGPQETRVLLGRPAAVGLITGLDTDIQTVADVRGKKVGYVQANPSIDMNIAAELAFGGLTKDDIEEVLYPGYGAMVQGFIAGEIDVVTVTPTVAALREAEGGRGVRWLDMPGSAAEGWARVRESSSVFSPTSMTVGVSISETDPADLLGYRYPQLSTYASVSEDEVYNLMKALDESYDLFKDGNQVMARWNIADSGTSPAGAPFHPGAIKYLREKDVWDAEDDAWNEARLAQLAAIKTAWVEATAKADAEKVSDADWPAYWEAYKAEMVK
jgi:uncharacterized protein